MNNKLFESQWQATKEALCEGRDLTHNQDGTPNPNKKQAMALLFCSSSLSERASS